MASGHHWNSVGDDFARYLVTAYQVNGEVHWPTLIASTAALSGEMALVANEPRLPEFGVVESRKVAEVMYDGTNRNRTIWGYSMKIAGEAFGVDVDNLPEYRSIVELLGVQLLPGSFPALKVAAHLTPRETPLNGGARHRKAIHALAAEAGFSMNDTSFALATAAMKMIGAVQHLGVRDLTTLALQSGVAGSRFVPLYEPATNPTLGSIDIITGREQQARKPADQTSGTPTIPAAAAVAAALGKGDEAGFGRRSAATTR